MPRLQTKRTVLWLHSARPGSHAHPVAASHHEANGVPGRTTQRLAHLPTPFPARAHTRTCGLPPSCSKQRPHRQEQPEHRQHGYAAATRGHGSMFGPNGRGALSPSGVPPPAHAQARQVDSTVHLNDVVRHGQVGCCCHHIIACTRLLGLLLRQPLLVCTHASAVSPVHCASSPLRGQKPAWPDSEDAT